MLTPANWATFCTVALRLAVGFTTKGRDTQAERDIRMVAAIREVLGDGEQ